MTPQKTAVIYARVSRDDSGEGRSTERQIEACRHLAAARDWHVVDVQQDISISASTGQVRPAWNNVKRMVEAGTVDIVIAWHIDRMLRSMSELEDLILLAQKHDVGVSTVSGDIDLTSDTGRMVARILAAVARAEVERKSARQKLANAQAALEGKSSYGGVRPFGYGPDMVTIVPEEAAAIQSAAKQVLDGVPLMTIAKQWSDAGLVSSRAVDGGRGWSPQGVKRVLINPRYAGIRMYLGEEVATGDWEPILDRRTHTLLLGLLSDPLRRLGNSKGRTPATLLSGIATCTICGDTVKGSSIRGRRTYSCVPGGHVTPDRAEADELALAYLIALLSGDDVTTALMPSHDEEVNAARTEREALKGAKSALARAVVRGTLSEEDLDEALADVDQRTRELDEILRESNSDGLLIGLDVGTALVEGQIKAAPLRRQRRLMETFLKIECFPQGKTRARKVPVTEQVRISRR